MVEAETDSGETRIHDKNLNKNNHVDTTRGEMGPLEARSRRV